MPHSKVVNDEKNIQALLSILDIVAQASADDRGVRGGGSQTDAS
jgi:hypothetical protein